MTLESSPDRHVNYAFLLGGLTAAIFGIIFIIRQDEALNVVVLLLGLWWLIQGAFMLFSVFIDNADWGWKVFVGILGLAAGLIVLANTDEAADFLGGAFAVILGIIGLLIGVAAVFGAFRGGGFGSLVFGVVSGLIGLLFILNAQFSFSLLVTLFGIMLLLDGVAAIYLAIRVR